MGVLNFTGILECRDRISVDFINELDTDDLIYEVPSVNAVTLKSCSKRKRLKSCNRIYDFRDYGIDQRRSGIKHQRRKENMNELLQIAGEDAEQWACDEMLVTAFTDLFLDREKMKVWESFVNLTDDEQHQILSENHLNRQKQSANLMPGSGVLQTEDLRYLQIDQKIRDMLRSKHMPSMGLLKYYENDVISCMEDEFPSLLIFNLEEKFDRMLVYAICQFFELPVSQIRLQTTTLIEIELPVTTLPELLPRYTLTGYLENKFKNLSKFL